jgi:hypothetical protein
LNSLPSLIVPKPDIQVINLLIKMATEQENDEFSDSSTGSLELE